MITHISCTKWYNMYLRLIVVLQISFITAEVNKCIPCDCQKISNLTRAQCSRSGQVLILNEIPITIESSINELYFTGQNFTILKNYTFASFNNLTTINFDNNRIKKIDKYAFKHLLKLRKLILSYNEIEILPDAVFFNLQQMVDINLSYNNIGLLQKHLFFNMPKLKQITLSYNNLSTIEEGCFTMLPSLKQVFLQNNKLTTVQIGVIDNTINLKYFNFNGNPWHCDDKLCSLLKFVSHDKMYMTCETPTDLKNKTWNQLTMEGYPLSKSHTESVKEGEIAHLECKYCFINTSKIINWNHRTIMNRQSQINTTPSSEIFLTSTLTLENVSRTDVGNFSCYTENCSACNVTIFLNVFHDHDNFPNVTNEEDASEVTLIDLTILYISAGTSVVICLILVTLGVCIFYCNITCRICKLHKKEQNAPVCSFLDGDDPLPFPLPESSSRRPSTYHSRTSTQTQITSNTNTDNDNNYPFCCTRSRRMSENDTCDLNNDRGRSNLPLLRITEP